MTSLCCFLVASCLAPCVVQVRDGLTRGPVAMAVVRGGFGEVLTDSSGTATVPPGAIRVERTGYQAVDTVAVSDTLTVWMHGVPVPLPPVVVTGSRTPEWLPARGVEVRRDDPLAQLVGLIPGVRIEQVGTGLAVGVRGASPAATEAWLDGMPLSRARGAGGELMGILPGVLEHVTVYQGWAPVSLGASGHMGGVSLVTPRTLPHRGLGLMAGAGTLGRAHLGAALGAEGRLGWLWAKVETLSQDNRFAYVDDNATPLNASDDTVRMRQNAWSRVLNVLVKGSLALERPMVFTWLSVATREGVPGPGANPVHRASHRTWSHRLVVHRWVPLGGGDLTASGFGELWRSVVEDPGAELSHRAGDTVNRGASLGGRVAWERQARLTPRAVVDARAERFDGSSPVRGPQGQRRVSASVGSGLEARILAGLRARGEVGVSWYEDRDTLRTLAGRDERGVVAVELTGGGLKAVGLVSTQSRPPSLFERFGDAGSVRGNSRLRSEQAVDREISVAVWDGALRFTAYRRDLSRLILFWLRSPKVVIPENVGRARCTGMDLTARWEGFVTITACGVLQHAQDRSSVPYYSGNLLPGWPTWSGWCAVARELGRWRAEVRAQGRGPIFLDRANRRKSPSQWRMDLTLEGGLTRTLHLEMVAENLFDRKWFDRWGYPEPGRRLRALLSYRM